jgi:hypothetical protein
MKTNKNKVIINALDKENIPIFLNHIYFLKMVPLKIENKIYYYSKQKQKVYGRALSSIPISKIIIL